MSFTSGLAIGCSVTIILGTLFKFVAKIMERRSQQKGQYHYYSCRTKEDEEEDMEGGEMEMQRLSNTLPKDTDTVGSRYLSTFVTNQATVSPNERRLRESTRWPIYNSKSKLNSNHCELPPPLSSASKPRSPYNNNNRITAVYSSPPAGKPRPYNPLSNIRTTEPSYVTIQEMTATKTPGSFLPKQDVVCSSPSAVYSKLK